jgi:hypothetical protein
MYYNQLREISQQSINVRGWRITFKETMQQFSLSLSNGNDGIPKGRNQIP